MGLCRTLDADVTIGCYCGDSVHVTTPFLRPFLFGIIFSPYTCLNSGVIVACVGQVCCEDKLD